MLERNSDVFRDCAAWKHPACGRNWKRTQTTWQVCSHLLGARQAAGCFSAHKKRGHSHNWHRFAPSSTFVPALSDSHQRSTRALGLLLVSSAWVSEVWGFRTQLFALIRVLLLICLRPEKRFAGEHLYCRLRNTYIYSWRCGVLMKKDMKTVNTGYKILCPRMPWFLFRRHRLLILNKGRVTFLLLCVTKIYKALLVRVLKRWLPSSNKNRHTPSRWNSMPCRWRRKIYQCVMCLFSRTLVNILLQ